MKTKIGTLLVTMKEAMHMISLANNDEERMACNSIDENENSYPAFNAKTDMKESKFQLGILFTTSNIEKQSKNKLYYKGDQSHNATQAGGSQDGIITKNKPKPKVNNTPLGI